MTTQGAFSRLCDQLASGAISRRVFLERAASLGVASAVALFSANAIAARASGAPARNGFAFYQGQDGTPAASPVPGATGRPSAGTEGQTRGAGGQLKLLQWQAVTHLMAHRSTGTKDFMAADLVNEPLIRYLPDGSLTPNLITEVPSVENGLLAEDLTKATFKLLPGIVWSDGEPFTANDIRFTWQFTTNPAQSTITAKVWSVISDIAVQDDLTAVVTYGSPSIAWHDPFTGGNNGHIYASHVWKDDPKDTATTDKVMLAPVGTGPYKLENITPNDQVTFVINDTYREPNKPFFDHVEIKGGGDPAAAARAVLQTGEYDYAWNLQVEPDVLAGMISPDGPGQLIVEQGAQEERININFSDPNTEVDGQRSEMNTPHPFFTDKAVRDAINVAIPRDVISTNFYGEGEPPTSNVLVGLKEFTSPNTSWEFDLAKANKLLDDAGWALDGDVRKKDGVELRATYATTVSSVRQKTQAVVKEQLAQIGVQVQLQQVDAGIFFDSAAGNDQNISHMYVDMNMYTNNATSSVPISYMQDWYAGPDNANVSQKSNNWSGTNRQRWINADYDATFEKLLKATTLEEAFGLLIQLNDILIDDRAVVPLVQRASDKYGISKTLRQENVAKGVGFEYNYWNIANWNRTS
ncbi:MAG TPA: peptide ABC transporter substrate-binding protein [Thermomicrobiales bacterium]|nr:peptide ABC transporter substrate-binding protein [Thermomicrobiales bacterium]